MVKNVEVRIDGNMTVKRLDANTTHAQLDLRIPRYTNDDVSYVAFRYSTSAAQESLARQGFSQTDISASGFVLSAPKLYKYMGSNERNRIEAEEPLDAAWMRLQACPWRKTLRIKAARQRARGKRQCRTM